MSLPLNRYGYTETVIKLNINGQYRRFNEKVDMEKY